MNSCLPMRGILILSLCININALLKTKILNLHILTPGESLDQSRVKNLIDFCHMFRAKIRILVNYIGIHLHPMCLAVAVVSTSPVSIIHKHQCLCHNEGFTLQSCFHKYLAVKNSNLGDESFLASQTPL